MRLPVCARRAGRCAHARREAFAARRPAIVIVVWLGLLVTGFGVGGGVFERLVADVGTVPGSESHRNAERRGFRIAYTRIKWHLPDPA